MQNVSIDSFHREELTAFWRDALGLGMVTDEPGEVELEPGAGSPENGVTADILFLRVPEMKSVKNRWHFGLRPGDRAAEVQRLLELGATRVDVGQSPDCSWVVLAGPEAKEFRVLRRLSAEEIASDSSHDVPVFASR